MGHNIHYATYPENVNKKIVQNEWDEYAAHEDWQEGCSGLPGKIRWLDHVCDTPEEAEEYISSHDKGNYDQLAVKFRDTNSIPTSSAKKKSLIKQIASYEEKKKLFDQAHSLANQKSAFISCPYCKSKLARQYLGKADSRIGSEGCPLCGAKDIRSSYVQERLKKFQERIDKWRAQLKEEEQSLAKKVAVKAPIKWLVKVEYHT